MQLQNTVNVCHETKNWHLIGLIGRQRIRESCHRNYLSVTGLTLGSGMRGRAGGPFHLCYPLQTNRLSTTELRGVEYSTLARRGLRNPSTNSQQGRIMQTQVRSVTHM